VRHQAGFELLIRRLDSEHGASGVTTNRFFRGHKYVAIGTLHDVTDTLLEGNQESLPLFGF
jgi:hypothetical protein